MTAMTQFVDYGALLRAFAAQCEAVFLPGRGAFTRTWKDFEQWNRADLLRGVACLLSGGIGSYPYEHGTTECGRLVLKLSVFGVLPEPASGEQIEEAEFAALREIERIAVACQGIEALGELKLKKVDQSQQGESPYWWVGSEWELFVEGEDDG